MDGYMANERRKGFSFSSLSQCKSAGLIGSLRVQNVFVTGVGQKACLNVPQDVRDLVGG